MSLLNFSNSEGRAPRNPKNLKLILGIGGLVGVIALGSTLAASINLNSGAPVEFGQGVAQTTACDGDVTVTPFSTFANDEENADFLFTSFSVTGIDAACNGKTFTIKAYNDGDNSPLNLYITGGTATYNEINVVGDNGNYSFVDGGLLADDIEDVSTGFKVTMVTGGPPPSVPLASAQDVDRITIESSGTASGAAEVYVSCESAPNDAPSYYPCGPQLNVLLSTLTDAGWTQCYSADFGEPTPDRSIDSILSACTNTYLAFLGQEKTGSTALLMAAAPRASITLETPLNTPNSINGSWWYYTKDAFEGEGSFGFAGSQTIEQSSCDIGDDDETSPFRYCIHVNNNSFGGFRIGSIGKNGDSHNLNNAPTDYLKVVYQHN